MRNETDRTHRHVDAWDEGLLRTLVPAVLTALIRRGEDFADAEDALQEALIGALRVWPTDPPHDPKAWLIGTATRRLIDGRRSAVARRRREGANTEPDHESGADREADPGIGPTETGDDTLLLLFRCAHPALSPASQVALTLRAVGGLTTKEIADAFFVPEATMAQRISRAKRTVSDARFTSLGDLAVVLKVLELIYATGHRGDRAPLDLTAEAIRLARQLTLATPEPEARGLLALLLLQHARLPARTDARGNLVPLDRQDRSRWNAGEIRDGVNVLQSALAQDRRGPYQIKAAIAALHDDAPSAAQTDWSQILSWYDELLTLCADPVHDDPAAVLSRAVAVGHALGGPAGLAQVDSVREVIGDRQDWHAVRGHLLELAGDTAGAATHYAAAADRAMSLTERDHLIRLAARARSGSTAS